jgi:hypothetical protein
MLLQNPNNYVECMTEPRIKTCRHMSVSWNIHHDINMSMYMTDMITSLVIEVALTRYIQQ